MDRVGKQLKVVSALLAACMLWSAAARAEPPLWIVRSGTATVYLFGTVHMLPHDIVWRTPRLDDALSSADALWLETDTSVGLTAFLSLMRYGLSLTEPLSRRLEPDEAGRLAEAARLCGIEPGLLDHLKPWLAALILSTAPAQREGFDPKAGVDVTLEADAARLGKPVLRLETQTEQLRIFADLPEAEQMDLLREAIDDAWKAQGRQVAENYRAIAEAWSAGDLDTLSQIVSVDEPDRDSPFYDALLRRRNQAWADKIQGLLSQGRGTSFIAVGAGHLVGPDSVQSMLAQLGLQAERY